MNFFKDCSKRKLRSVSSSRLTKNSEKINPVKEKFLYLGEVPKKIGNIVHRSITPERSQTPIGQSLSSKKIRPVSGFNPSKKVENYLKAFKRKVFREKNCVNNYFTNLFIEQLVSVPICERKSCNSIVRRSVPRIVNPDRIELGKKFKTQKGTMTEVKGKERLVIICEPFPIEETDSIASPIKPKYL